MLLICWNGQIFFWSKTDLGAWMSLCELLPLEAFSNSLRHLFLKHLDANSREELSHTSSDTPWASTTSKLDLIEISTCKFWRRTSPHATDSTSRNTIGKWSTLMMCPTTTRVWCITEHMWVSCDFLTFTAYAVGIITRFLRLPGVLPEPQNDDQNPQSEIPESHWKPIRHQLFRHQAHQYDVRLQQ